MVGHALSGTKRRQNAREAQEKLMKRAVLFYQEEQDKDDTEVKKGLRGVCNHIMALHKLETGKTIPLPYKTLEARVKGTKSKAESNAEGSWLLKEEERKVIEYIGELAHCGFPLSHRRLKEHVDAILRARIGDVFPANGVGTNW
ncbi:hypothetical protein FIBSPDRAFT_713856, partial [Athelia psychrophila]